MSAGRHSSELTLFLGPRAPTAVLRLTGRWRRRSGPLPTNSCPGRWSETMKPADQWPLARARGSMLGHGNGGGATLTGPWSVSCIGRRTRSPARPLARVLLAPSPDVGRPTSAFTMTLSGLGRRSCHRPNSGRSPEVEIGAGRAQRRRRDADRAVDRPLHRPTNTSRLRGPLTPHFVVLSAPHEYMLWSAGRHFVDRVASRGLHSGAQ